LRGAMLNAGTTRIDVGRKKKTKKTRHQRGRVLGERVAGKGKRQRKRASTHSNKLWEARGGQMGRIVPGDYGDYKILEKNANICRGRCR